MPEYQFGREVTVKLPEPDVETESTAIWRVEGVGAIWLGKGSGEIRPHFPALSSWNDYTPDQHARLSLALLAASDYAENGDQ